MNLNFSVARHLDDPPKIIGLSPNELASSALFYAGVSPILRGVPLAALLSLGLTALLTTTLVILGRTFPANHGLFVLLRLFRPGVSWIMPMKLEVFRK
jgi:hypothetical protein